MDALKIFVSPWQRPRLLFPKLLMGFCCDRRTKVRTKFEVRIALPVPEIIEGTLKLWAAPGYPHAPFSPKFLMAFCSDGWTL